MLDIFYEYYEIFLILGDCNKVFNQTCMKGFCDSYYLKNPVK